MIFAKRVTRILNEATGSIGPRSLIDHLLKGKAHMLDLKIDSTAKTINAVIQMKDQPIPIKVFVKDYRLEHDGSRDVLRWSSVMIDAGEYQLPPGLKGKLEFIL
jgi:hypothetical protein